MKVSVIIPVYNTDKYVSACLESVLAQTYSDLEILIVDDGSTDDSSRICNAYASHDRRVKVIRQDNAGVSAARNRGVEAATGDYIVFVDSDDTMHPQMIAHLLGLVERNNCAAAFAKSTRDNEGDMTTKGRVTIYTPAKAIEATLYQEDLDCSLWGKLFPAEAVKATRQDVGRRYEDLSVFYKIYELIQGNIAATSAPLYFYRRNPESFISNFTISRMDVLAVTEEIERHYSDNRTLLRAARDRRFSANYNMMILATRANMTHAADRCWDLVKRYRGEELLNPHIRLKNKIGALLSYFGRGAVMRVAARIGYE